MARGVAGNLDVGARLPGVNLRVGTGAAFLRYAGTLCDSWQQSRAAPCFQARAPPTSPTLVHSHPAHLQPGVWCWRGRLQFAAPRHQVYRRGGERRQPLRAGQLLDERASAGGALTAAAVSLK